jgi:hypothetical protein
MNFPLSLISACDNAWALNVYSRDRALTRDQSEQFYELKNKLVEYLYRRGYCYDARLHIQKQECWDCEGTGTDPDWGGDCEKCRGTGVYRESRLYAFAFRIGRRTFKWHQPADLVTWPVTLTEAEPGEYTDPPARTLEKSVPPLRRMTILWWCLCLRMVRGLPALCEIRETYIRDRRWSVYTAEDIGEEVPF